MGEPKLKNIYLKHAPKVYQVESLQTAF